MNRLLYICALLGLPAAGLGIVQTYVQGRWLYSLLYAGIYICFLLGIFASRKSPYRIRALLFVSWLFLIAFAILMRIGMSGVGLQLMLGVCFLTALFFSVRTAVFVFLACLVGIVYVALGMITGFIEIYPEQMLTSKSSLAWMTGIFVFFIMVGITVTAPDMLKRRIEESLDLLQQQKKDVETANQHLEQEIQLRRQAEEALRKESQRLAAIIEGTNVGTWEWNIQTGETFFNERWADIIGFTLEEISPVSIETWERFSHPDDIKVSGDLLRRHFSGELNYYECEARMRHKDGHWIWVLDRGKVSAWAEDGKPLLMQGTHQDITKRKSAENALRSSEARFRTLAESSPIPVILARAGTVLFVNRAFCELVQMESGKSARGTSLLDFVAPEERGKVAEYIQRRIKGESAPLSYESIGIRKDGTRFPYEINVGMVALEEGTATLAFVQDITQRKRAEKTLRESEELFSKVFKTSPGPMTISEIETGRFIDANDQALRMLAFTREELIGRTSHDLGIWDNPEDRNRMKTKLQSTGSFREYPVRFIAKTRNMLDVLWSAEIITLGSKKVLLSLFFDITDRKRAEEALRESEGRYRQLTETAHDVIVAVDLDWTITYVNRATLHYWGGMSPVGMSLLNFTPPHLHELQEAIMQKRREGFSDVLAFEWDIHGAGGRIVTFDIRASLLTKDEKPSGVLFVARDITERKKSADALQQRASELTALNALSQATNATLDVNETVKAVLKGIFEAILPDLTLLFLKDGEHMILKDVLPHDERLRLSHVPEHRVGECLCGLSVREKQPLFCSDIQRDNRCVGEEYKRAGIESFAALPLIGGGEVIGVVGLASVNERDFELQRGFLEAMAGQASVSLSNARLYETAKRELVERKRAEEALRNSEEVLVRIVAAMPDIVLRTDLEGNILFVNESVLLTSGYSKEDLLGQNMLSFISEKERGKAVRNTVLMYERQLGPREYNLIMKDGRTRLFEVNGDVLRNEDGTPYGLVHVCRDITERRRAEEEKKALQERLQRSEKMEALGQMAGGVAHDLNNILGALSGYSELLVLETTEGQRSRSHAEKILQSTEKAAAIIQDLLTLTRRGGLASEVVNLNGIVAGFMKSPVFEKIKDTHPGVIFQTQYDENLLNTKGASVHLEKTLMNLIANAAESISGKGGVMIRTQSHYLDKPLRGYDEVLEGEYAVLAVSDTGVGIPEGDREKIFEPFYTKKVMGRSGTGLGLAIVWGTVKDHNGYIDVQSEQGVGTTFSLFFPATREETTTSVQAALRQRYRGHGESVLVVDDIAEQRDVAAGLLTTLGYRVHAVSGGEEAVEYLRLNRADILVLDMIMTPGIDGLETYKRILEMHPNQKAILVSGFSETERVKEAQRLGAGTYVKKPYLVEKIGMAIREELDRK